jgi:hypothetical protein
MKEEMVRACSSDYREQIYMKIVVGKREGMEPSGRTRHS